jgi:hypothetical protein
MRDFVIYLGKKLSSLLMLSGWSRTTLPLVQSDGAGVMKLAAVSQVNAVLCYG